MIASNDKLKKTILRPQKQYIISIYLAPNSHIPRLQQSTSLQTCSSFQQLRAGFGDAFQLLSMLLKPWHQFFKETKAWNFGEDRFLFFCMIIDIWSSKSRPRPRCPGWSLSAILYSTIYTLRFGNTSPISSDSTDLPPSGPRSTSIMDDSKHQFKVNACELHDCITKVKSFLCIELLSVGIYISLSVASENASWRSQKNAKQL